MEKEKREKITEYYREYRDKNRIKIQGQLKNWKENNRNRVKVLNQNERDRLKEEVLRKYSKNESAECILCGYSDIRALTIDHINNNGAEHREELFGRRTYAGTTFYRWLRKNDYPAGYQTLCFNCNWIKEIECRR